MKHSPILSACLVLLLAACTTTKPVLQDTNTTPKQVQTKPAPIENYALPVNGQFPPGNYYIMNVKSGLVVQGASTGATLAPLSNLQRGNALQVFKVEKKAKGYRISMAGSSNLQFMCLCAGGHNAMMIGNENKDMAYNIIPAGGSTWYLSYLPEMGNYIGAKKTHTANYTEIWLGAQVKNEETQWRFIPERNMSF